MIIMIALGLITYGYIQMSSDNTEKKIKYGQIAAATGAALLILKAVF